MKATLQEWKSFYQQQSFWVFLPIQYLYPFLWPGGSGHKEEGFPVYQYLQIDGVLVQRELDKRVFLIFSFLRLFCCVSILKIGKSRFYVGALPRTPPFNLRPLGE